LHPKLIHVDESWTHRFIDTVRDYIINNESPYGWVNEDECDWLIALTDLNGDSPSDFDVALLIAILRKTEGAPDRLADTLLTAMVKTITVEGFVSADRVEDLRAILFAPTGHQGHWVSRLEAKYLFEINDAVATAQNAPSWDDFFARAIANHLMARAHPAPTSEADALARENWLQDTSVNVGGLLAKSASSFFEGNWWKSVLYSPKDSMTAQYKARLEGDLEAEDITSDEHAWVNARLGWDNQISPAEKALINFLKEEVPGYTEDVSLTS
ncbi:MAG: hypothetical protein AAFO63_12930, partial [Pseudomonadota bacterium]